MDSLSRREALLLFPPQRYTLPRLSQETYDFFLNPMHHPDQWEVSRWRGSQVLRYHLGNIMCPRHSQLGVQELDVSPPSGFCVNIRLCCDVSSQRIRWRTLRLISP